MNKFILVLVILAIVSCVETEKQFDWGSIWDTLVELIRTYGKPYAVQWCENYGLGALCGALIDQILKWLGY